GSARFEEALANFPGIWGLDAAVTLQLQLGSQNIEDHILGLNQYAIERLRSNGCLIFSPDQPEHRSGLLSFVVPNEDVNQTENRLAAACVDLAVRDGRLRISPSYYNEEADIDRLVEAVSNS
ncbi:MAG: aminotransferase class V-fold PLP-dependent enzyme, partial [Rhodospirillales bacterium]|nr:aminotransferase class V-fold PLP-dependent enzyme [Rhodospirillales bacterium]